jgi:hypothetical protein
LAQLKLAELDRILEIEQSADDFVELLRTRYPGDAVSLETEGQKPRRTAGNVPSGSCEKKSLGGDSDLRK